MPARRAYRIAYDGRPYHGFQRQPDVPTVAGELLAALESLGVVDGDVPPGYAAAGRTDAGVSAVAQTVAFDAPAWLSPAALDGELPASIRAWAWADADGGFHATHDATGREYTYYLHAEGLGVSRAREALDAIAGSHDFRNLTPDDHGTERTLELSLTVEEPFFVLTVRAGGFARQLVRRVVSLLAEIAGGDAGLERVERVLTAPSLDGPEGVAPAPAQPLVLTDVTYPDLTFRPDPDAVASARTVFEKRRRDRLAGARVAGTLLEGLDSPEEEC